jgi:tetratricopeptide (TPR) repeat protein
MQVKAWKENIVIPTYKVGEPDKNPMFLEKRVYQGSSGVVYPHAVIDKVYDEKEDKEWIALFLENEYIRIMILPELGGRIQMAYDKTNDYHFVYYNEVIKPALVGLTGPWISGGIEFNWPQHHRPSTFGPTDFAIDENPDGSKTIWINEYEVMFRTKCALGFTLYPGKAYIELHAKLYNRTPFPQTFLWWANPAVSVDEHYQSVFPPDVHAVYDHGRRDVSSFPIAKGIYYKVDYSPGTDISVYTNIPVPTSYMAADSNFDFVAGYHHRKQAGIAHVADHHISPGKKQWTWGSGEFGRAWDRQLTDTNGPYFELMCGVYTDNQPDFSWIMPNEFREFKQYFMPYKEIGHIKNASIEALVNLEIEGEWAEIKVYVTSQRKLDIRLLQEGKEILRQQAELSPYHTYSGSVRVGKPESCRLEVWDASGILLTSYTPVTRQEDAMPEPGKPLPLPSEIGTAEELYLAGLHLEQYRHATRSPVDYYKEGLSRDPSDIRHNNALGLWFLRRGEFRQAEMYFRKAIQRLTRHNANPYDGEPLYNLGLSLKYQDRLEEAFDVLYKSTWNAAWQDNAFLQLAYIVVIRRQWQAALELTEKSLARNIRSLKARHLKAIILRQLGRYTEAMAWIRDTDHLDHFDPGSLYEGYLILLLQGQPGEADQWKSLLPERMGRRRDTYIEIALDYAYGRLYEDARGLLSLIADEDENPLTAYYMGYFEKRLGNAAKAAEWYKKGFGFSPDRVFPNRIEDVEVLKTAKEIDQHDYKSLYYLGNFYYSRRLYEQARDCWESSMKLYPGFPTAHRNLGIAYYNKFDKKEEALQLFDRAFRLDNSDGRILFELDQLYMRVGRQPEERLAFLQAHEHLVRDRDDLYIEYVGLHTLTGRLEKAASLLKERVFHPWEGGEGKTSRQHVLIHIELAKKAILKEEWNEALVFLQEARMYPEHLGEGKLYGAQENDIFYWLGYAYEKIGEQVMAANHWEEAAKGVMAPSASVFYNDQQPDKIFYQALALRKLGRGEEAATRFYNLITYGREHLDDEVRIDYFAVSLPDLTIFEDDLNLRNQVHCHYLMGLGYFGLEEWEKSNIAFTNALRLDPSHAGTIIHHDLVIV